MVPKDKLKLITLKNTIKPIVFSEFGIKLDSTSAVVVEESLLDYPAFKKFVGNNTIVVRDYDPCSTYSTYPIENKSMSTDDRIKWINDAKTVAKTEKLRREQEEELQKELKEISGGIGRGTSFSSDVSVLAKLGYGIAIFDCDCNVPDEMDTDIYTILDEIIHRSKFHKLLKQNKVYVTEWVSEDCRQIWFVDANTYIETDNHHYIEHKKLCKANKNGVETVYKLLCEHVKEKYDKIVMPDLQAEWMLHLYYSMRIGSWNKSL